MSGSHLRILSWEYFSGGISSSISGGISSSISGINTGMSLVILDYNCNEHDSGDNKTVIVSIIIMKCHIL